MTTVYPYSTDPHNALAGIPVWQGVCPGTPVSIFGYSSTVGSTALGPLWEGLTPSGGAYAYPSSAVQMSIVSNSTSDTSALSLLILGLDGSYNSISETIALNGTTTVTTVNSYFRINDISCTNGNNVGKITVSNGATTYAQINPGIGQTQMSIYTVPNGHTFWLYYVNSFASIGFTSSAYMNYAEYNKNTTGASTILSQTPYVQSLSLPYNFQPIPHPGGTDIQFQFKASTGTNTIASCYAGGVLI